MKNRLDREKEDFKHMEGLLHLPQDDLELRGPPASAPRPTGTSPPV